MDTRGCHVERCVTPMDRWSGQRYVRQRQKVSELNIGCPHKQRV